MSNITNPDKELGSFQKFFLVLLTIVLVILLFFFKNGFKESNMLTQLANNSLLPEEALTNGKPTIFEFYADWCEACKEMAPSMYDIKNRNIDKVDVVLLNVDNTRWIDLIDIYEVNGIPQLNFFDSNGDPKGFSVGVRKYDQLNDIFEALITNSELPAFSILSNSSQLISKPYVEELVYKNNESYRSPRDHI